jgi:Chaperone of endosialidase
LHRTLCIAGAIGAMTGFMIASDGNAFSIFPIPNQSSNVMLVAGGCGPGFHRGPYGGCRPNVVGYPAVGYGGGVYRGGVYRGGVYRGGVYRRGVYRGGAYRGRAGGFRGGAYRGRGGGFRGGRRSDIRLKHDITLLGHLNNDLGFYRFVYNGGEKAYVGVMAQEVQRVTPTAVVRDRHGYLKVFYDKLGLKFQTYDQWMASGARVPTIVRMQH